MYIYKPGLPFDPELIEIAQSLKHLGNKTCQSIPSSISQLGIYSKSILHSKSTNTVTMWIENSIVYASLYKFIFTLEKAILITGIKYKHSEQFKVL